MTHGPGVLVANKREHRFMWVDLQIKHLCAMKIDSDVEAELGKLPDDLATTYDQIYKRIQDDIRSAPWAQNALMWILVAEEPLSPEVWAGGVSWALPGPDEKSPKFKTPVLLDVCQNLVVHDGQQNVMRFAHLSVREFLEAKALDRQAAEIAAFACLAILQHPHTLNAKPADFTPFHRYSIRYWPEHVLRCDDDDLTPQLSSTLSAFMGSFVRPAGPYIHWFKAAKSKYVIYERRLRSTPLNPLIAAAYFGFKKVCSHLWEQNTFDPNFANDAGETLLYLASSQGHIATVRLLLQNGVDVNHLKHHREAPLLAAIQGHYPMVLNLLLDAGAIFNCSKYGSIVLAGASVGNGAVMLLLLQRDASIEITGAVVTAAAGNENSGREVMELLLQRDSSIEITEAIITAAAGNRYSGKEVMELLLQRDTSIEITEAIITAAAGNWYSGKEVMELLLQRDATKVTEAIVTAAAENPYSAKEVMELLLQRDASIEITEAIVTAAARNWDGGKEVMELLLQRDATIEITEAIVTTVAQKWGKEVMGLLLRRGTTIEITEAIVTAAVGNEYNGKQVMELLLQRDASIEITKAIVTAAARNQSSGKEVMELLLQRDASVEITEAIVSAAAGNWSSGKEVMELLLQRDASIEITEAIVTAAAGNQHSGKEVMELLLQRDVRVEITEAIVTAAAGNRRCGEEVMELLLQRDASIEITKAIVATVARNWGKGVMELLLQRDATIEITEAIVTAAAGNGKEVMELLLQRDATIEITEAIITAAARNLSSGKVVVQQLLQRDATIEITEAIVTAAAGNEESGKEVMELLLKRDANIEITEAIVTAAAGNPYSGKEVMELLLQRDASIEITEAIITAAAGNEYSGEGMMQLLLQRDAIIEITEAIVTAAAVNEESGKEVMKLLLWTDRTFATKSSLIAAAFFAQHHWFESLYSKIDANSLFPQNDMQCLIAAIEGGNTPILDACLVSSHMSGDTDDHGWTLHMVAIQSKNQKAIEKLQDASEELMQPMSVTRWDVSTIIFPFVSIGDDGTSLIYSGNLPGFTAEFQALTITGSFLTSGLSVKGNHPFRPGNMGKNYFEVEVLDSVESRCVVNPVRCASTNLSAATCALDSAANVSCIKACRAPMAAHRPFTVMEVFDGTVTGTLTERHTARGIS
jgi:predicted acetyltransferase